MTTVFHARPYGRFIELQSNLRRKKIHRTNQGANFGPVHEWRTIALACTHTRQYLFRHAIIIQAKLYELIASHCFSTCIQLSFCK